ncbi:MAG: hypothetical protein AB1791_17920 [Chloroflexota bacterium]
MKGKRRLLRNFLLELLIYGGLVFAYFLLALRLLDDLLFNLSEQRPAWYAIAALGLIVVQGVALEAVTSFLIERLGLERLE